MNLLRALRLDQPAERPLVISFVGAGGKTTALFQLARQLLQNGSRRVIVTATTHLGIWQIPLADHHVIADENTHPHDLPTEGVVLVTGKLKDDRTSPISANISNWLRAASRESNSPLLIEADGSRQKPLKAPADHEPPIPEFSDLVIHVSGLSALGQPLNETSVHREGIFSKLSGLQPNEPITTRALLQTLTHPQGGLKNIPPQARRIALLNQADTPQLRSIGGSMAPPLLKHYHAVIAGSLHQPEHFHTFEQTAGIILAAGQSTRFGAPKQLLDWKGKPFVRCVAETALRAGLEPVVVVAGFHAPEVISAVGDLPVTIVSNPDYPQGQSTSIKAGLSATERAGAAVFLLADQPQIPAEVIRTLKEEHSRSLPAILAPLVLEERRANPVLFDRTTFPALLELTGDVGGRAIFDKFRVQYLPWHDDLLILDVDKPEDYERLMKLDREL